MPVMSMFAMTVDSGLPEGVTGISLSVVTEDRLNMAGAVFSVSGSGGSQTASADASGRAYVEMPSGSVYSISIAHGGTYTGDAPLTVNAESRMQYGVLFDLRLPRVATDGVVKRIVASKDEPTESDGQDGDLWLVYE